MWVSYTEWGEIKPHYQHVRPAPHDADGAQLGPPDLSGPDMWANRALDMYLSGAEYRTRVHDKAILIAFGVNGEVPLAQARINAGLDKPANDNFQMPAVAAA